MRPSVWRLRVKSHPAHSAPFHQVIITIYTGRVGTDIRADQLADLWRRLRPLQIGRMPFDVSLPRSTRFGLPLVLSRVHCVRPELVVEVKYLTWTEDGLLQQVIYEGVREDKPAREVVRV